MDPLNPQRQSTPFWEKPLHTLDRGEWEALCDGCGKCCLHKVEDEETGNIYPTNVACRLLDTQTGQCTDYRHRKALVPDCMQLTKGNVDDLVWLPSSCTYKLRAEGLPIPEWHYLKTGDHQAMILGGHSVSGRVISETRAGPLEHHIVDTPL